jgi:hypothetical protein
VVTDPSYEFASPEWIAEAAAYLPGAVAAIPQDLDGITFSLCEIYTDPPSHLADGADRIGWSMQIDGRDVKVLPGVRDDAEQKIVVDYGTCIPLAKAPYKEVDHAPGKVLPDSEGPPRVPGVLVPTLVRFHNHMARHTR